MAIAVDFIQSEINSLLIDMEEKFWTMFINKAAFFEGLQKVEIGIRKKD